MAGWELELDKKTLDAMGVNETPKVSQDEEYMPGEGKIIMSFGPDNDNGGFGVLYPCDSAKGFLAWGDWMQKKDGSIVLVVNLPKSSEKVILSLSVLEKQADKIDVVVRKNGKDVSIVHPFLNKPCDSRMIGL